MYLPEDHRQMYDILTELRVYAAANGLAQLAEKLDDAMVLLIIEGRDALARAAAPAAQDS
ncbi:hypothetical protein HNP73_002173 [Amaricoccus macauensis]|uniref:Uncharacterized protein n=1 Tax=Amaricoccus macauensis TaxID=57001 RepID=A0A840SJY1_9RHOB|nr:hypothetical protein [Amaricoccus macauensis]MBB5222237.1 hypothetical protein [Amaricoccus macauensis]